jgi:hypothetical protein
MLVLAGVLHDHDGQKKHCQLSTVMGKGSAFLLIWIDQALAFKTSAWGVLDLSILYF